jgi:hypothetical protein
MGKRYILFLVKNPDFMHILFFSNIRSKFKDRIKSTHTYDLFTNCVAECKKHKLITADNLEAVTLMQWSYVHGLACLLAEKTIEPEGNLRDFVSKMIDAYISVIKK